MNRLRALLFLLLPFILFAASGLRASTVSGTVKDPSGAVIAGARVEITGGDLMQPVVLTTDEVGRFVSGTLKPGKYALHISKDGFAPQEQPVDLTESSELQITLAIAKQEIGINVPGTASAFANSDPVYRKLRDVGLGDSFRFDKCDVAWDVGSFHFEQGILTFISPVEGVVTGAIFVGEGHFNLKPVTAIDMREIHRRATRMKWTRISPKLFSVSPATSACSS